MTNAGSLARVNRGGVIQPDSLYELSVSRNQSEYELLATPTDGPCDVWGQWQFESAEDIASALFRLDMSAVDYIGVDQWLNAASSVQVGHPIKGTLLLAVLGAVRQPKSQTPP